MYNVILVPLDGSHRAETILPHVEELALCTKARIVLMRVIDPSDSLAALETLPLDTSQQLIKEQNEAAESYLTTKQGELKQQGINTSFRMRFGPVVQSIIEVAQEEQADLIAIASHGRTGLARIFYGSVAAGLLQRADRPLLLIRAQHDDE